MWTFHARPNLLVIDIVSSHTVLQATLWKLLPIYLKTSTCKQGKIYFSNGLSKALQVNF